eukprot:4028044-Prorocentrum_lima.AAC.1
MTSSLVGSEMCIRDSNATALGPQSQWKGAGRPAASAADSSTATPAGAESERLALHLADLKRQRAKPSNSPGLNRQLDWDIQATIGQLQSS